MLEDKLEKSNDEVRYHETNPYGPKNSKAFYVNMICENEEVNNDGVDDMKYITKRVKCPLLTEKEKADGWRYVLPNPIMDKTTRKKRRIRINCSYAQVPEHLWSRLRPRYIKTNDLDNLKITHYTVTDRIYYYYIEATPVDQDIIELANLTKNESRDLDRMKTLIQKIESYNIDGWVLIRAKRFLRK